MMSEAGLLNKPWPSDSASAFQRASTQMKLQGDLWASLVVQVVKNQPATAGHTRDSGSIPGSGRSPGGGPGESHGQRSLAGYSLGSHKESDTPERLTLSLDGSPLPFHHRGAPWKGGAAGLRGRSEVAGGQH